MWTTMKFQNIISVLRTKCTKYRIHSFIFVILLIVHNIKSVSSETVTLKPIKNMETIEVNSEPVFRVIVNRDNNDIIVGARNAIYKLSPNDLQKTDEFITGPVNDSIKCLPPPNNCTTDRTLVNNDNQILVIKYDNKDFPLLLACGDAYQGLCHVLKPTNLSWSRIYGSSSDPLNFVGSKSSSFAFFAPSPSSDQTTQKDVLYVAHSYDERPVNFSPPSISSRKFNGYRGFALTHNSGTSVTKKDIHPTYKQTFNVKYLYGFNYTHYSYFVSTQPINVRDTQEYETKLIRICQNDNEFFSYIEIPLICGEDDKNGSNNNNNNGKNKSQMYYIASTAYFGKIGSKKFRDLEIESERDSHTLFVAFGVQTLGTSINKTFGSAICAFSMKKINRAFTEAVKECAKGGSEVQNLEVIEGQKRECTKFDGSQVNEYFCGTGFNPHIGSNRPLNGFLLNSVKGQVTSLAVAIQGTTSVAAIGTEDGRIMKVLIEDRNGAEKPLFEMNLSGQSSDKSIRPNPAFDNQEKYLYLLSGNQLVKFPFGSCSLHTDCSSCLDPSDPLRCGWCGSYCATSEECQHPTLMSYTWCPPEVFEFTPKSGPLLGGTVVTISGDNLGEPDQTSSENSNIKITIAGSECELIDWQPRRVQCRTKHVEKEVSGLIEVYVHDVAGGRDRHFDINGTAHSQQEFKYLDPELRGVNPSFGPFAGGTIVTIVGNNLNIGSNRTILLAGIGCKEIDNNSTFLSCLSGPYGLSSQINGISQPNPSDDTSVKVFIDAKELIVNQIKTIVPESTLSGDIDKNENLNIESFEWSEFFEYKPNPIIKSLEPNTTIKRGNTTITVTGNNLNSVKNPQMQVLAFSKITKEEVRTQTPCKVNELGSKMTCKTPPIRDPIPPPKIKVPIETQISFIMDGVKDLGLNHEMSRLIYFPDPLYYPFSEDKNLRFVYLEEPELKIDGKDLSVDYPIDIKISGRVPCNLTHINSIDSIKCVIEYDENIFMIDDREHYVDIKVGGIHFSPGKIKFTSKPSNTSVGTIMVSTLVPILLLAVIVAAVIYYLKSEGVILKKKYPDSIQYIRGDSENGDRPPFFTQHSHNNYVPGSVTRPLLSADGAVGGLRFQVTEEQKASLREEHILIERSNIKLEDVIGQGHFGIVYKGILNSPEKELEREVAVKTLHSSLNQDDMDIESFLQEGIMMKDFKHHHVLTLIGVCFEDDGSPIVVLPYMQNGDLLSYIREEKNMPTVKNLLTFAIEIAQGMDYLSSQKFVHRDLAARNCMLDSDLCVKVADFGLSRDIYERDYYSSDNKKCKLPVKWMSPESLEKGTYNTKTDVWSYGVLVWELLTRGVTPYPDVDNWEILNYLKQGRRMPRPSYCPELLYFILLRCWAEDPKTRPTFAELCDEVQSVITKLEKGAKKQKVGLNVTYVNYPIPNTYANDSQAEIEQSNNQKPSVYETTC